MSDTLTVRDLAGAASAFIALFALGVSAWTHWSTRVAPFKLGVAHTGRVTVFVNAHVIDAAQHVVFGDFLFTNYGAKPGHVRDLTLKVTSDLSGQNVFLLRALHEQVEEPLNLSRGTPPPPKLFPFAAFSIKPGETVRKVIQFSGLEGTPPVVLTAGRYRATLFTTDSRKPRKWKDWPAIDFVLTDQDLVSMQPTVIRYPDGGQYVEARSLSKPTVQQDAAIEALMKRVGVRKVASPAELQAAAPSLPATGTTAAVSTDVIDVGILELAESATVIDDRLRLKGAGRRTIARDARGTSTLSAGIAIFLKPAQVIGQHRLRLTIVDTSGRSVATLGEVLRSLKPSSANEGKGFEWHFAADRVEVRFDVAGDYRLVAQLDGHEIGRVGFSVS